jgi:glutamine---fructose-6-phosphate transaminase (isomerizing)
MKMKTDNQDHFTWDEIQSQPDAWAAALQVLNGQRESILALVQNQEYSQVLFTGCGSTYYLALAAATLFQELSGAPARGVPASELWLNPLTLVPVRGRVLLVALSRSGETTETLHACEAFRFAGRGELVTLSCYEEKPLSRMGNLNLVFPSGQEQSVAQTRAFSTLFLGTLGLAALWSDKQDLLESLQKLPALEHRVLDEALQQARWLGQDSSLDRFYFLGSGPRYGLGCELSLKMKEMSLSYSEPYHFLEFRHGPKAMVTPSTLIVGLLSQKNYEPENAVLEDMRTLGARVLAIGEREGDIVFGSGLEEAAVTPLYLGPGQLLALERALSKGLNPDRPHNLDSVVKLR